MTRILILAALVCGISGASCLQSGDSLAGEGTVHRGVGPECPDEWHIATSKGILWPVKDPAFQIEGLRVRFRAREVSTASTCMAGQIVEFDSIEKL
ncbi:MAG TPA: hypothetical protein VJW75_06005 [Candidatus Eisenbacteria bacterium]|nr:hypothetical protein [Candidatus Eisenbacteria bacterium]